MNLKDVLFSQVMYPDLQLNQGSGNIQPTAFFKKLKTELESNDPQSYTEVLDVNSLDSTDWCPIANHKIITGEK